MGKNRSLQEKLLPLIMLILFVLSSASAYAVCTDNDLDGYGSPGDISCPKGKTRDCNDNDNTVYPGAPKICDGKDNNCDGRKDFTTDEDKDHDGSLWCAGDCNDNDAARFPGNPEICDGIDNDCVSGVPSNEIDSDGDTYRICSVPPDCNNNDASINPGSPEICGDNKDNNCNGQTDEAGCVCPDADGDGQTSSICGGTDCNDSDNTVYVGAPELCTDGKDNNCNGIIDIQDPVATGCPAYCLDTDGDNYFVGGAGCGIVDCDDTDANVHPGAATICDGKDSNCDGREDFSTDKDADNDGVLWCAGDCDDSNPSRFPGNPEICDGIDNDCAGGVPGAEADLDGDTYLACGSPADCNDNDRNINPGIQEYCSDSKDNNCNGQVDEAGCICPDADADGFTASFCGGQDCDDNNAAVNPNAVEVCTDGIDNNCNGVKDLADPTAVNCPVCIDNDSDGYAIDGGLCGPVDCDDADAKVYPGAPTICDGKDSNCDGRQDFSTDVDADNDGFPICVLPGYTAGDCNDTNPNVNPSIREGHFGDPTCSDGVDNDCDNQVDAGDGGCAAPTCGTKANPNDGPHFVALLNSDGTLHPDNSQLLCGKCHNPNDFLNNVRYQCQRCHADPNDTSDPLNGTFKTQYPLAAPYGFGSAPNVKMHSSTVVGAKYGNWDTSCTTCHNPHQQEQNLAYKTTYGKYIKEYICLDNPVTGLNIQEFVKFTAATGTGSFADGAPHNENVCEMCHTQTNHHRRDGSAPGDVTGGNYTGHNDNSDCVSCHPHSEGFKPAGGTPPPPHDTVNNCNYCHVDAQPYTTAIPDSKCEQCHTATGALKASYPAAPNVKTHSSANGSGKYTYSNTCVDCHDPMHAQTNLKAVRSTLAGSAVPGSNIVFTALSGTGSFSDGPPYNENVCSTCHTMTNHHQSDGTAPGGQSHNDGTACTGCHPHGEGFRPSGGGACGSCHGVPPATGTHLKHFGGTIEQASYGSTAITQDAASQGTVYIMNCGNCHPIDTSRHMNSVANSGGGSAEIELYNPNAPAGSLKALNPPSAAYTPGTSTYADGSGMLYTMGTCSNVYCHSYTKVTTSAEVPLPSVPPYYPPLVYNPPWESLVVKTTQYKTPTWGVDSLGCNGCHGNPTMTSYPTVSAGAGDSHGWVDNYGFISLHVWNMGFAPLQCNTCHNDTVRADATWSRTEYSIVFGNVPIYNTAKHVNGNKDVVFTLTKGFYSGNVKLTGASFDPATKNCSNVVCHGPQTPVKWGTPYRSWNAYECDVCHQGF